MPKVHNYFFGDESSLRAFRDSKELKDEDIDVLRERDSVYALPREDYWKYPLVAKDIRKVYPGVNGRPPKVANTNICFKIH